MRLEGNPTVLEFDPFQQQQAGAVTGPVTGSQFQYGNTHNLGAAARLADNRVFRYALAGAVNLVAGNLQLPIAEKANHYEINPSATAAIGATQVSVTLGATAAAADEYDEGYLVFSSGNNAGIAYTISRNPAISLSTAGTIYLYEPLVNSVATSDTVDLVHNTYQKVIISPAAAASQTTRPAGVPLIAVTAAYGCWLQTRGVTPLVADGTVAVGTELVASSGTAGAVTGRSTTWSTAVAQVVVGVAALQSVIATNSKPAFLKID